VIKNYSPAKNYTSNATSFSVGNYRVSWNSDICRNQYDSAIGNGWVTGACQEKVDTTSLRSGGKFRCCG
jgi:hypothetical protein